jgi:hypothetical protein
MMRRWNSKLSDSAEQQAGELQICSACGAKARRGEANYCLVCGKLMGEGYQPLDYIRSSYRLQQRGLEVSSQAPAEELFSRSKNSAADTAWACVVYSMVPYLGIMFIPFALIAAARGYFVSFKEPHRGGRQLAMTCVGVSLFVLAVQVLLWWLLYIIPELGYKI